MTSVSSHILGSINQLSSLASNNSSNSDLISSSSCTSAALPLDKADKAHFDAPKSKRESFIAEKLELNTNPILQIVFFESSARDTSRIALCGKTNSLKS